MIDIDAATDRRRAIADARLVANHDRFVELVSMAEERAAAGNLEAAALAAAESAAWAWTHHPGIHASPRLERLLRSIVPASVPWKQSRAGRAGPRRILHVLTQVYPTGGHTRWSDRIIQADRNRVHSVAIVNQGSVPIPPWLVRSVTASGGELHLVNPTSVLGGALKLRRLASEADLVLANVHPHDVVSVLALADPRLRPPVAALNHADHAFWLGASAWDLLVDFRRSGAQLAQRRRGAILSRSTILPLPLDMPGRTMRRDDAKRALGLRADEIVLLSAGSDWKFDPLGLHGEPTFPEVLAPIVERDPRLRLFVLGPPDVGRWTDAARRTGGRLRALGTRTDYDLYKQAADIYLDPFPLGSMYSLLEPGALGVPLLSFNQWPTDAAILVVDSPGLGDARIVATSRDAYETALLDLIADPVGREARGRRGREQIVAAHAGPGWLAALDAVVAAACVAREAHLAAPVEIPAALDTPVFDALARGLASIVEQPALPPECNAELPLAG
jgi:hypothetical protein